MSIQTLLIWFSAFLLGSIPSGMILAKLKKVDLRKEGSGNIGATNVARSLGKTAGLLTLVADSSKGYVACWIAAETLVVPWQVGMAGILAFLGHIFSVFLRFKGGKGIATGLGIYLYLMPWAGWGGLGTFILTTWATGYVSIGSLTAALAVPALGLALNAPLPYVAVAVACGLITALKHKDNILRLKAGTESKFLK